MGYDYAQATTEELEQWAIERLLQEYEELQAVTMTASSSPS